MSNANPNIARMGVATLTANLPIDRHAQISGR